jgi:hypothetical protein
MHNGQVGGYDGFRRDADMMIPEALYPHRKGATDSEALFLVALAEGLDDDPRGALERAAARFIRLARAKGQGPHLRMTAALSDGQRLYAVRYCNRRCRAVALPPLVRHQAGPGRGVRAAGGGRRRLGRSPALQLLHLRRRNRDGRGFPALPSRRRRLRAGPNSFSKEFAKNFA